jgi:hypothetical protein
MEERQTYAEWLHEYNTGQRQCPNCDCERKASEFLYRIDTDEGHKIFFCDMSCAIEWSRIVLNN